MRSIFYSTLSLLFIILCPTFGNAQWDEKDKLVASDRSAGVRGGEHQAVAIYGDYAVVGSFIAPNGSLTQAGAAYVYKRDENCNWVEVQKLAPDTPLAYDRFGISVAIFGNIIAVGSYRNNEGAVFVFENSGGSWVQTQMISSGDPENGGAFGCDVDMYKNRMIVGSWGDDSGAGVPYSVNSGAAYIFEHNGTSWLQVQKLVSSDRDAQDQFGQSVSIYGNSAVVGASFESEDANGLNTLSKSGSAYIFERIGANWSETQKLTSTDRGVNEYFGRSLDMASSRVIVGVQSDHDDENGANPLTVAGSAFIFKKDATTGVWSVEDKIVASDRATADYFGSAVAMSNNVAVVGIFNKVSKGSGSTPVDGGAVYTFDLTPGGWVESGQFSHSDAEDYDRFGASCEIWQDRIIVGAPYEDEDDGNPPANTLSNAGSAYIFEVTTPATQPTIVDISSGSGCAGGNIELVASGANLNDAAQWQWYEGSCNSTPIGTGITITLPSPSVATTYYANGVGGCVNDGLCGSLTIFPNQDEWPKRYGNNSSTMELGEAIAMDNNGNVFVHGTVDAAVTFENGATIPGEGFLAKYDNCGVLLWVRDVGIYGHEYSTMKVDNQGNPILLTTTAIPNVSSDIEFTLTKFNNSNGNVQWSNTIEMWKPLPWPSFDIDMSTNEIYLAANVSKYLRITQSNGATIVNYTAPTTSLIYPKDMSYLVKYNSSGMQVWQDKMYANAGYGAFQDVVVAENTNRVYLCGYVGDHPNPTGELKLASNGFLTMSPTSTNRLFIASYLTTSGVAQYANMQALITGSPTALQIEYSNTDDQIYVNNFKRLDLFNASGNFISTVAIFGKAGSMHYNQADNYLLLCGNQSGSKPQVQKYQGTTNIWTYTISGTGYVYGVHSDPTSDKIFLTGSYRNTDLTLSPTDILPLAGGRDVFISNVTDAGPTVQYLKKPVLISSNPQLKNRDTSIAEENKSELTIYPNPSTGIFAVEIISDVEGSEQQVEVYNTTGRLIYSVSSQSQSFSIDLSGFDSGLYHLIIRNENGTIQRKLIKQ